MLLYLTIYPLLIWANAYILYKAHWEPDTIPAGWRQIPDHWYRLYIASTILFSAICIGQGAKVKWDYYQHNLGMVGWLTIGFVARTIITWRRLYKDRITA